MYPYQKLSEDKINFIVDACSISFNVVKLKVILQEMTYFDVSEVGSYIWTKYVNLKGRNTNLIYECNGVDIDRVPLVFLMFEENNFIVEISCWKADMSFLSFGKEFNYDWKLVSQNANKIASLGLSI